MRVLHWFPNYFHGGGVANAVTGLARALADEGAEVAIAGVAHDGVPLYGEPSRHPGVELLRWRAGGGGQLAGLSFRRPTTRARAELQAWGPDVVHVHAEFAPDNLWATRLFRCPLVLGFHGALHPEVFRKGRSRAKRAYVAMARRMLYPRVSRFTALCPAEARHIREVLPGRPVDVIPLGARPAGRAPEARPAARGARIVFVGRLDVYTKGLDLLVAAFGRAKERVGDAIESLTLVGPDWRAGRAALQEQIVALGLADAVRLAGPAPGSAVGEVLAEADAYAQLSRHDAFPLSVVDALVTGMPVLLSSSIGTTSYAEVRDVPHVTVTPPEVGKAAAGLEALVDAVKVPLAERVAASKGIRELFCWRRIASAQLDAYQAARG
jgi:glycosyltransferase involved in cell wall biosynthesis